MIVWLASYPKSGNTWLRLFLQAYQNGTVDINKVSAKDGDLYPEHYDAVAPVPLKDVPRKEVLYLRTAALYRFFSTRERVVLKTHCANVIANGIQLIPQFFTERAVYIVRDPRDIAVSYSHHVNEPVNETISAMEKDTSIWKGNLPHYVGSWSDHVKSWLNAAGYPVLVIRYEDMLAKPERVFGNVVDFLGDRDEERLKRAVELTSFGNLQKQERENGFIERPSESKVFFRKGTMNQWKNLKPFQVKRIENAHGEMMTELGYELAG